MLTAISHRRSARLREVSRQQNTYEAIAPASALGQSVPAPARSSGDQGGMESGTGLELVTSEHHTSAMHSIELQHIADPALSWLSDAAPGAISVLNRHVPAERARFGPPPGGSGRYEFIF